jgi:hypothetical protein
MKNREHGTLTPLNRVCVSRHDDKASDIPCSSSALFLEAEFFTLWQQNGKVFVMPLDLQIIQAAEFIQVGTHGTFDLVASREALATLAGACRRRGINLALLDLRDLRPGPRPVFTPADLASLVGAFPEMGFGRHQRLAILYHSDPHKRARLFAFLSSMHGWNVQAFGDFEKALIWLSSKPKPNLAGKQPTTERRVPIRIGKLPAASAATPVSVKGRQKTIGGPRA